jgi:hypothetical protein
MVLPEKVYLMRKESVKWTIYSGNADAWSDTFCKASSIGIMVEFFYMACKSILIFQNNINETDYICLILENEFTCQTNRYIEVISLQKKLFIVICSLFTGNCTLFTGEIEQRKMFSEK